MIAIQNYYDVIKTPDEKTNIFYLPSVLDTEYFYDNIAEKKVNITYYDDVHCEFVFIKLTNIECKVTIKDMIYKGTCDSSQSAKKFIELKIEHFEFLQRIQVCKNLKILLTKYGASRVSHDKLAKELECIFYTPIFTIFEEEENTPPETQYFRIGCHIAKTDIMLRNKGHEISLSNPNDVSTILQSFWLFEICEYKQMKFWNNIKENYKHLVFHKNCGGSLKQFLFNADEIIFDRRNVYIEKDGLIYYKYFIYIHCEQNKLTKLSISIDSQWGNTMDFQIESPTFNDLTIESLKKYCLKLAQDDKNYSD